MSSEDKFIKFNTGALRPKNSIQATSSNMNFMKGWKKQGKDYDIVSPKILNFNKGGLTKKKGFI